MRHDLRWLGFVPLVLFLTTVACSDNGSSSEGGDDGGGTGGSTGGSGGGAGTGGSGPGTGLPSGTACVRVDSGAEVCVASGVTAERSISSGEIRLSIAHVTSGADCQLRAANEFIVRLAIPDLLPFPYQATQRRGDAQFGNDTCYWMTKTDANSLVSGTIYQAGTNGATNVEGDVTVNYDTATNGNTRCGESVTSCLGTASARFRFNVPL